MRTPMPSSAGVRTIEAAGCRALQTSAATAFEGDGRCPLITAIAETLLEVLTPAERALLHPAVASTAGTDHGAGAAARGDALVHYAVTELMAALLDGPDPHRAGRVRRLASLNLMQRSADLGSTQWELGAAVLWCVANRPDLATQVVCRWLIVAAEVNLDANGELQIDGNRPSPALSAGALIGCLDVMLAAHPVPFAGGQRTPLHLIGAP